MVPFIDQLIRAQLPNMSMPTVVAISTTGLAMKITIVSRGMSPVPSTNPPEPAAFVFFWNFGFAAGTCTSLAWVSAHGLRNCRKGWLKDGQSPKGSVEGGVENRGVPRAEGG